MNIFVRNNVDYTPLMWAWLAICLIVLLTIYVEVMCSTRRQALKRVRPLIEELLRKENSDMTVKKYIQTVETRYQDRFVWTQIHKIGDLAPLYMILDKEVELVS
jgi:hypothetical protein